MVEKRKDKEETGVGEENERRREKKERGTDRRRE